MTFKLAGQIFYLRVPPDFALHSYNFVGPTWTV